MLGGGRVEKNNRGMGESGGQRSKFGCWMQWVGKDMRQFDAVGVG